MIKSIVLFLALLSMPAQAGLPPTTSKGSGDAAGVVTFNYQFPNFAITHTGPTASLGILSTTGGGTGNSTGTATNATNGATVSTSSNASFFPLLAASSSNGNQPFNLGTGLTFNPSTNNLSTTTFTGALVGNADSSTNATNGFTIAVSNNADYFVGLFPSGTGGNQAFKIQNNLKFNPFSNTLTAAQLVGTGGITGTLTGTASGNLQATPNNHGVIVSGSGNTATVVAPCSTGYVLVGNSGADPVCLPVGSNGQELVADSNQTSGVRYAHPNRKNYLQVASDAEVDTSGWATYADAAGNVPVDCTGGTATSLTFSRSTSSPLRGAGSFSMVQTNSTSLQGKGVSAAFTIDSADQAKALQISYDFNASSTFVASNGTTPPLNDGTTTTNAGNSDVETFVYDVTNSVLIPVTPQVIAANGANNFTFKGTFQTASNSTSYRVCQHVATTSANATGWTFKFDNFYVGPQALVQGAPVTDWTSYTPTVTSFGTTSASAFYYRRVGDSLQVTGNFTMGSAAAALGTFTLPSGLSIDTTKIPVSNTTSNPGQVVGYLSVGTSANQFVPIVTATGTSTSLVYTGATTAQTAGLTPTNVGSVISNSQVVSVNFSLPVAGWSSGVQMSNDGDTRVVSAAYSASSTFVTNGFTAVTTFYDTKDHDSHGAYNTTTGLYTIPVSGTYKIEVMGKWGTITSATEVAGSLKVNGSSFSVLVFDSTAPASNFASASGSFTRTFTAGDTVQLEMYSGASSTMSGGVKYNHFSINRISGPATIAASDSVSASVFLGSTTSFSATNVFKYDTVSFDTHGAYSVSTGLYTVPTSGKYQISITGFQNVSGSPGLSLNINGTQKWFLATIDTSLVRSGSIVVNLKAGDTFGIFTDTTKSFLGGTNPSYNTLSIARIGN